MSRRCLSFVSVPVGPLLAGLSFLVLGCSGGHGLSGTPTANDGGPGGSVDAPFKTDGPGGKGKGDGGVDAAPVYPLTLTPLTSAETATDNITLFFSVSDATGKGVTDLSCSPSKCDFEYLEDGTAVDPFESAFTVRSLSGNALVIKTVLLLQTSPSIVETGELPILKAAAKAIVAAKLPEQQIEIATFADQATPNVRIGFSSNKTDLDNAIDGINSADGAATNLYGSLIYAFSQWMDDFSSTTDTSTAGVAIVITNGSDNTARATLGQVIEARGNKRVLAVGVGTPTTLDTAALDAVADVGSGCPEHCALVAPSFQALETEISDVTDTIASLGHSIYLVSYCSPKRNGPMNDHTLTFTVAGNEKYNTARCTDATFTEVATESCATQVASGSSATQACFDSELPTGMATCCPANEPFACASGSCYATASEAAAACSSSCVYCGGDGSGAGQNDELEPGTEIVVQFDSANYTSGQCPAEWGPNCKALAACCGKIESSQYSAECTQSQMGDVGNQDVMEEQEMECQAGLATYCPTPSVSPNCSAFLSCCQELPMNSDVQSNCFSELYGSAEGSESACMTDSQAFCPTGPECSSLASCCVGLPSGSTVQSDCYQQLESASGDESTCTTDAQSFCPTGPDCSSLKTCCAGLPDGEYQDQCFSQLEDDDGNESDCPSDTSRFCPTGPNCSSLKSCCDGFPAGGQAQDDCFDDLYNESDGDETECQEYDSYFCPTDSACSGLKSCCSGFGPTGQELCLEYLVDSDDNASECNEYGAYACPTGPNCTALKNCCEALPTPPDGGTADAKTSTRSECEQALLEQARGSESECQSLLSEFSCSGG